MSAFDEFMNVFNEAAGILGTVGTAFDLLTGAGKDAAEAAAAAQLEALDKSISFLEGANQDLRDDLKPYRDLGEAQIDKLKTDINQQAKLIKNPEEQRKFVAENPFFDSLANEAQQRLFNNQAAKGKVGSGGTAEALQNSLLLLGTDLVNQNVNQRQLTIGNRANLVGIGENAAAQSGNQGVATANNIASLTAAGGDVTAASIVAGQNARTSNLNQLIKLGGANI